MSNPAPTVHSVEQSCTSETAAELLRRMDAFVSASNGQYEVGGRRDSSVHEIPGHTPREAGSVYEPNGRIECTDLPADVTAILDDVFDQNLPALQFAFPTAVRNNGWFYVAYGEGQYVNPHVDYHGRIGDPWPGVLAAVSLTACAAESGGKFFVETSGDGSVWEEPFVARRGLDYSTPSFGAQRRVRWTAESAIGDLLVWGSQVIHGTTPVEAGRSCKFLTQLLTADLESSALDG